ncbi:endonuclease, partial [Tricholoma matsutake]
LGAPPIPVICTIILTSDFPLLVALIVENSLLRPEIMNVLPKIGRYGVYPYPCYTLDSLHTVPNSLAFSAPPFSLNAPSSAMDTSECLDALESKVTGICTQIDSLNL